MHGLRPQQPIEIARACGLERHATLGDEGAQPLRGVLGGHKPGDRPVRIGKRRLDGVEAKQQDAVAVGASACALGLAAKAMACRLIGPWSLAPHLEAGALSRGGGTETARAGSRNFALTP